MKNVFDTGYNCCGCSACKSICLTGAITMVPDSEGFLYPNISQDLCVNCGLCRNVCPLISKEDLPERLSEPYVFAVKHKVESVKMNSASGGAYTAISEYAIERSNTIYGVEFSDNFLVQHSRATCATERDKFRGSKYVQSDPKETYNQIRDDLISGKGVLFTGTACQAAGLRRYLSMEKVDTDKLIINDIVCHGTTSPLLWKDYLHFIQRKKMLKSYTFRSKEKGWRGYNIKVQYENGSEEVNTSRLRVYSSIFSSDLALRPSCYQCQFANLARPSDITIGDFWGIEKTMHEIDDNKGVSLVILNTNKGKEVFDEVKKDLFYWESSMKDCLQHNLQYPTAKPQKRDQFWFDYNNHDFEYIAKKYAGFGFLSKTKAIIKKILARIKRILVRLGNYRSTHNHYK